MSPPGQLTAAQMRAAGDLDRNFCVTSGAGCGKTRVLVERYIRYLEDDLRLPLERLAAITFTEMAAAEMRDRIRRACRDWLTKARAAGDAFLLERWRSRYWDVDVAPIHTIHGFCAGLLHRFPIEAGVDPNFRTLDETSAALLLQEVVNATVETLLEAGDADLLTVLEHFTLNPAREMLAEIVGQRREELESLARPVMEQSDDKILKGLKKRFDQLIRETCEGVLRNEAVARALGTLRKLAGHAEDKREQIRREMLGAVEHLRRARTAENAAAAVARILAMPLRGGSAKHWPSPEALNAVQEATKSVKDAFKEALDDVPPFDEEIEKRHLTLARALFRTARHVIAAYDETKRERSALDFEDLQIRARNLLRDNPAVRKACRDRFRAILVDELQDTNLLQFEIVDLLTSGPGAGRKAPPLRRGALFAVGDPKQSIYRFRGARVEVFERALKRVGPKGRQELAESFRLNPGVAALVNHLFPALMGEMYEPIEARHEGKNAPVAEWIHVADSEGRGLRADEGYPAEARRLAERLEEIVKTSAVHVWDKREETWRPARYGDVAILLRRTSYLHVYEEALERQGIPYYVVAGRGFYKQQEVLDVLHLLRVLDDPSDELSLAGLLRSPFFAVSDEGLYHLRQLGGTLYDALPLAAKADRLDEEDRRGLARAARLLPRWAAHKDRMGPARLLDAVVFESGYAAGAVGRFGGERAYANLRQMAELARRFDQQGLSSLGDYIDFVTDFMRSEMRQEQAPVEAPGLPGGGGDTVRIMTIHKAKGLEFPVVVVPDLGYAPSGPRAAYFIHPATGLAVRLRDEEGDRSRPCALVLARREAERAERQENHRLLYVAMTRTQDYLIFASHDPHQRGNVPTWADVLARGLDVRLEEGERSVTLPGGESIHLRVRSPAGKVARRGKRRAGPRDVLEGGRVLWDRLRRRAESAPRGRLKRLLDQAAAPRVPVRPPTRISATALETYCRCPAEFWWRHVVGLDDSEAARGPADMTPSPREMGLACHRALELAASGDEAAIRTAVDAALRELPSVARAALGEIRRDVAAKVALVWTSPLGQRVARAKRVYREMPLLLEVGETEIAGKADLIFQNTDGEWELVDYKSRADGPADEQNADAYRLQLSLYAMAAERWLGRPVARWSVCFLDSAAVAEQSVTSEMLRAAEAEAKQALEGVANGRFQPSNQEACRTCRSRRLCGR